MRRPDPSRSHALLIGSARYLRSEALRDVPVIDANVADLAAVLTDPLLGGLRAEHCHRLPEGAATEEAITLVEDVAKRPEDLLLIYFAGHGLIGRQGELYLCLSGTHPDRLRTTALPYEAIREACLDSPAANRVVILDCCYAGRAIGEVLADGATALLGQVSIDGTYTLAAAGRSVLAVALAGEPHTAFTGRLITLLRTGAPDAGELLSLDEIYRHVHSRMVAAGLPKPVQRNTDTVGQLALVRNAWFGPGHEPGDRVAAPTSAQTASARLDDAARDAEHVGRSRPARAAQLYADIVDQQQRRRGTHAPATLFARARHAYYTGAAGRYVDADRMYRDVLVDMELVLGPEHREVCNAQAWAAYLRGESGERTAAVAELRAVVAELERQRAAGMDLLTARRLYAWQLGESGDRPGAEAVLKTMIAESSRTLGADHEVTLLARRDLARQRAARGGYDEAARLLSQLEQDLSRVFGAEDIQTLQARFLRADVLAAAGLHADAVRELGPVVAALTEVAAEDAQTLTARLRLATSRLAVRAAGEAYADLRNLVPDLAAVLGPHDPRTIDAQQALAAAALGVGDAPGAVEVLRDLLPERHGEPGRPAAVRRQPVRRGHARRGCRRRRAACRDADVPAAGASAGAGPRQTGGGRCGPAVDGPAGGGGPGIARAGGRALRRRRTVRGGTAPTGRRPGTRRCGRPDHLRGTPAARRNGRGRR
jgi:protein-disulfide isomerase-like protein with CxxC motif